MIGVGVIHRSGPTLALLAAGLLALPGAGCGSGPAPVPAPETLLVTDTASIHHLAAGHPERPERLRVIHDAITARFTPRRIAVRPATEAELGLVHTKAHIDRVRRLCQDGGGWVEVDTYLTPQTYEAARRAAGALVSAVDEIAAGRARSGFCAVRPPGHHATADRMMGFCIFNNVAVAARYIQRTTPWKRVMIVDFDVHHGNGTEDIFSGDPTVFYLSVHRRDLFPWRAVPGAGAPTLRNLSFTKATLREAIVGAAVAAIGESATAFQPDFILVSAGFDAYRGDPIGGLGYEVEDYRSLMEAVVKAAPQGRVLSTLEGGYDLDGIGRCAAAHFAPLVGR
jgi:acetoin utilization deacetylase AcuC-like enzyme